jgi:pSer/pThr/pTyr-binding forkhead associated (FHA) protein
LPNEVREIGIVCGQCDTWSRIGTQVCPACANELTLFAPPRTSTPPPPKVTRPTGEMLAVKPPAPAPAATVPVTGGAWAMSRPSLDAKTGATTPAAKPRGGSPAKSEFADLSQEELMEQARNYVCRSCSSGVPTGHKFCGRCGTGVPIEILNAQTLFFGDMQNPAKAKLILIRGEGMDGLSFHLKAEQHIVGRNGQLVFPDDPFVSPKHANFFYRDGKLVVRDEGSLNGVYIRVRGTVDIAAGDTFLAGEQLFRLDPMPRASDGQDPDGTYFYSSPKHPSPFRLVQILQGGATGMTVCARGNSLQIGREGGDLNFPMDLYMSGSHCRIEEHAGKFTLTDLNSRNGTYVRIKSERDLAHGDYLFIGRKLLRVELNTN